mgnify:FL=1
MDRGYGRQPPEYNRTAHDFDIATWDRLKRIDVEPDFAAWRDFAVETGVHPAVLTYLDIERDHFYRVETTVDASRSSRRAAGTTSPP